MAVIRALFNTRRDSYTDADAEEEVSEGPSSASFADANTLTTSSTAEAIRCRAEA
jgi:hypothetical protein